MPWIDRLIGVVFLAAPTPLGRTDVAAACYRVDGFTVRRRVRFIERRRRQARYLLRAMIYRNDPTKPQEARALGRRPTNTSRCRKKSPSAAEASPAAALITPNPRFDKAMPTVSSRAAAAKRGGPIRHAEADG